MSIAANILFQFIFVMNANIRAKEPFARLAAVFEAAYDIIHKSIILIVITPVIKVECFLRILIVMFLRKGTAAVCNSRYILNTNSPFINTIITGSCNCNARKSANLAGRQMRVASNEGRGTINLQQSREVRKEKRGISFQDVNFKFLYSYINFHHEARECHTVLRVTNHEGRRTIFQPRINTNKHNKYSQRLVLRSEEMVTSHSSKDTKSHEEKQDVTASEAWQSSINSLNTIHYSPKTIYFSLTTHN